MPSAGKRPAKRATARRSPPVERTWIVYILECRDRSLYTGITNDVERRLAQHQAGAKYTAPRRPVRLRYTEDCDTKSAALKREAAIKALPRTGKVALITATSLDS